MFILDAQMDGNKHKTEQQHTEMILKYFVCTNSLETTNSLLSEKIFSVVLSGKSYFKGFLLEARDAGNQDSVSTVGTFTLISPDKTQLLTCGKHKVYIPTQAQTQSSVQLIWHYGTNTICYRTKQMSNQK